MCSSQRLQSTLQFAAFRWGTGQEVAATAAMGPSGDIGVGHGLPSVGGKGEGVAIVMHVPKNPT